MERDEMTAKERATAFLAGQDIDRLMCVPLILNHAARVAGLKVSECSRSGELLGKAHVAAFRKYGQDLITIFTDTSLLAEGMGTRLYYAEDDAPRVDEPAVGSPEEVERIRPADPKEDGRLPVYLKAIEVAREEVGEEVLVSCCYAMPFTTAAALMGTEKFIKCLYRAPDLAHRLLALSLETALRFTDAVLGVGGVPVAVDPVASCSVIGPRQFREFAAPYITPIIERIHQSGLPGILHICGKSNLIWDEMANTGAEVLSLDKVDLEETKWAVGERVCLFGNVAPAETLLYGTPQLVEEETRQCIRKGGDNPKGFIVGSGCEVPLMTPPENVFAMIEAVRKYGRMPLRGLS